MMTQDSRDLLREYRRDHSEEAFRELVGLHSPLVYGTALRKLGGDRAAAQDVTQEVFTLLVRKAGRLENVVLSGWLYRQACRRAANHVRTESRRKLREKTAMETMPHSSGGDEDSRLLARELDDAMMGLPAADRDALVLRFFEGKEYRGVGQSLGLSEEAARKRVQRALDKLGMAFKRKGIAVGGVSLGTAMQGMGAAPVSPEFVARVSGVALKNGVGTAGSSQFASLLKPVAAGVIATSLVAGSALAMRKTEPLAEAASPVRPTRTEGDARGASRARPLPENLTIEDIIAEIKLAKAGPGNVLTNLRLGVVLDKIRVDQIPAFIALGNVRLSQGEKIATYAKVLERWGNEDAEAALDFCLSAKVGKQVDSGSGTNLLNNLFAVWRRKDRAACGSWVLARWEDETLAATAFIGSLRSSLGAQVAKDLYDEESVADAFRFIRLLPVEGQRPALEGLVGMNPWAQVLRSWHVEKRRELHVALKQWPEPGLRDELLRNFWTHLGEQFPKEVEELAASAEPSDRFEISLGKLAIRTVPGETVPQVTGGYVQMMNPVTDREAREAAALQAGLAAGIPREQVVVRIAGVMATILPPEELSAWFDAQGGGRHMDGAFAAQARKHANAPGYSEGEEMKGLEWAARITDPDLRLEICRGVFRRALSVYPEAAMAYLDRGDVPADLKAEFKGILEEVP